AGKSNDDTGIITFFFQFMRHDDDPRVDVKCCTNCYPFFNSTDTKILPYILPEGVRRIHRSF
ncbi:MAG TPA: hypothetical protein PLG98_08665, partial [Smithella sp.]|nr:hypothetical protein [Smithella sp.]